MYDVRAENVVMITFDRRWLCNIYCDHQCYCRYSL